MARWTFYDGVTTYKFDVNPNAGGSPKYSKRFFRAAPANPRPGFTIRMEGRPHVPQGQFSGAVRSQLQYQTLLGWAVNKPTIQITDDLGRVFTVVPLRIAFTPAHRRAVPWRTTYEFQFAMLTPSVV